MRNVAVWTFAAAAVVLAAIPLDSQRAPVVPIDPDDIGGVVRAATAPKPASG